MKRSLVLLLALLLTFGITCTAQADKDVVITSNPRSITVAAGGNAAFSAAANNATGITWRLVSPDGSREILVKDVGEVFPGVTYTGRNGGTMTLIGVTPEMNGWSVYCTFNNSSDRQATKRAYLYVTGGTTSADNGGDASVQTEGGSDGIVIPAADGPLVLTVVGATLKADGYTGNVIDFSNAGKISFKVTAASTPAYWVINGARYDFDQIPTVISVRDLNYSMTIEAVRGTASTLLSEDELQQKRTGEPLIATSKNADLCFITANGQGKGGWFREFDFTNDYTNLATGLTEQGGSITLRCRAYVAQGRKIAAWEFNKVRLTFSSNVTEFTVTGLNQTMEYHPITAEVEPTEVPPTYYTVTCEGCTFSGGGYTNATSGKVLAGTKVTFNTKWSYVERWQVNGLVPTRKEKVKEDEGYWDSKTEKWVSVWVEKEILVNVQDSSITRTINKDTHVVCDMQIN